MKVSIATACGVLVTTLALGWGTSKPASAGFVEQTLGTPLAYWRLGETSGDVAADSTPDPAIDGTYIDAELGQPSLIPTVPDNTAVRFNGTSSGVNIPDFDRLNLVGDGDPFLEKSVLLWFIADDANTATEQVIYQQGGGSRGLNVYVRDGSVFVGAWNRPDDDSGVTSPWVSGEGDPDGGNLYLSVPITSGQTYQVGLVMSGDATGKAGTLTGYLNGAPFGEKTGVGRLFNHGGDVSIGYKRNGTFFDTGNSSGAGNYFAGVIDEVALYNVSISPGFVSDQYVAAVPEPGSLTLLILGALALAWSVRKRG